MKVNSGNKITINGNIFDPDFWMTISKMD